MTNLSALMSNPRSNNIEATRIKRCVVADGGGAVSLGADDEGADFDAAGLGAEAKKPASSLVTSNGLNEPAD